jgi:hypothetical protein
MVSAVTLDAIALKVENIATAKIAKFLKFLFIP